MNRCLTSCGAGAVILVVACVLIGCSGETAVERASGAPPPNATHRVPSDYPTIQAAIDAAALGDTVLVAPGTYTGPGNRNITFPIGSLVLMSEGGPSQTILDCQGTDSSYQQGMTVTNGQDNIFIRGFTIKNAYAGSGAAIYISFASPDIRDCVFVNNSAPIAGGAIWCKSGSPAIRRCTFIGNWSESGGAAFLNASGTSIFADCLFAYNDSSAAVWVNRSEAMPAMFCCNIFGNPEGDWVERIAGLESVNNNLSVDPRMCGDAVAGFRLEADSPCLPQNNACGRLIGAIELLCD